MPKAQTKGKMASTSKDENLSEQTRPLLDSSTPSGGNSAPSSELQRSKRNRQIWLGIVAASSSIAPGMSLGFSAVSLRELGLPVSTASWFASAAALAFPIGALLAGPVLDKLGRRPALILINVISIIGWLLLSVHSGFRPPVAELMIGRILNGVSLGLAAITASVYVAECLCADDAVLRTSLVTWSTVALAAGIFLVYALGAALPFYAVSSIATLISILSLILVAIFLPESPAWLISRGRQGDAESSQKRLNLPVTSSPRNTAATQTEEGSLGFADLSKPEVYKPLAIMSTFFFFQQFSGVYVMIAYMTDMLRVTGATAISPSTITVVAGSIILLVAISATFIYPKTGVRSIATISGAGMTATLLAIAFILLFRRYWFSVFYIFNWILLILMLLFIAISSVGFLILPWSMLGEVFPLNVKGFVAGLAGCIGFLFGFLAVKTYPFIRFAFGISGLYFFFGIMSLLGTLFVIYFLPETKGKTLQEIIDGWKKKGITSNA